MGFPSKNHSPLIRRLTDPVARAVIRIGYRALTPYWRKREITRTGVGVIIRHDGKVLTVRHSYRPEYTIPGAGIGRNETPAIAVVK